MRNVEIKLTRKKLKRLVYDGKNSAKAVNLIYVSDIQPGIKREKINENFVYKFANRRITSKDKLDRIRKLVIPPAWTKVWICADPNGHLQVTGYDALNRKQYKYHPHWNIFRNHTKFSNLYEFGKALPIMRKQLQKDLSRLGLPVEKVLATIVSIMQLTCMRIGNGMYEKLYGSFGLTTLKDEHVQVDGSEVKFSFKGKKGIYHSITLKSKKLANIVKQCRNMPGKKLFQYYNAAGTRKTVDSNMVNNYIKDISDGNFTAKDFRTWAGSLHALSAFKKLGDSNTITAAKKKIVEALDIVAKHLGNTRAVCKKYYVHPMIIEHYMNKTLNKFTKRFSSLKVIGSNDLNGEEQTLMTILERSSIKMVI